MPRHVPGSRRGLLLASASPRRRALLASLGLSVDVLAVNVDERPLPGEEAAVTALRLAHAKALAARGAADGRPVLAADTIVLVDDALLGKPRDADEARAMLRRLSGCWHEVLTGVALALPDGRVLEALARTAVRFAALDEEEIERYTAGSEPYDKAGGYALQGTAAWFVEEVRGSVTNVVGLPLEEVRRLFRKAGLPVPPLRESV
ncbi:MAG: septum formation inhibitor Maf [Anaeromyxobacteraceae bacterium]|nr:septum formation inhibitor Maf [Anaeromyxobacteraceae bacterium]